MEYIDTLEAVFSEHGDPTIAKQQKDYMKGQFEYFGLKSPLRRELCKPFLVKAFLPPKNELEDIVRILWQKPQRDFHYFALDLILKYKKQFEEKDLYLWEHMALNNSWWDTIDVIAPKLLATQFLTFPHQRDPFIKKWLAEDNIWLQRCCLLFQLKYKEKIDLDCLEHVIDQLLGSKEFFINKAIGWMLREHSKRDAAWVSDFIELKELSNLSKREASKYL